jgi:predicted DsbA family dithiol-disulfide isomerase
VTGYGDLLQKYQVRSVPMTVVGDGGVEFVGAQPEEVLLEHIQKAASAGGLLSV